MCSFCGVSQKNTFYIPFFLKDKKQPRKHHDDDVMYAYVTPILDHLNLTHQWQHKRRSSTLMSPEAAHLPL